MRAYFTGPRMPSADPVSLSLSLVTVSDATIQEAESATLTLTVLRRSGQAWGEGGIVVVFSHTGGTSVGSVSATTDQGLGVYTATFTATTAGTATTISATIDGAVVTSALPTVTVSGTDAYDPLGISLHSFAWDDFTTYADTTALRASMQDSTGDNSTHYTWTSPTEKLLASINTVDTFNGHHVMEYDFPDNDNTACQPTVYFYHARHGGVATHQDVWFRYRERFTPGFRLGLANNPPGTAAAYKNWFGGWSLHNNRIEIELLYGNPATLHFFIRASNVSAGNPGSQIAQQSDQTYDTDTAFDDGLYREGIIHCHYTDVGARTWEYSYWYHLNGVTPIKRATLTGTVSGGGPLPTFAFWQIGGNYNRIRTEQYKKQWGSWEMADGDVHFNPFNIPAGAL